MKRSRRHVAWMVTAVLAAAISGCHSFNRSEAIVAREVSALGASDQPFGRPSLSESVAVHSPVGTPLTIRSQSPSFGNSGGAGSTSNGIVGTRYAAVSGPPTIQPVQYQPAGPPYGAAPPTNASSPYIVQPPTQTQPGASNPNLIFQPPGTGVNPPLQSAPPRLPYGATGQTTSQPPFVPDSPLVVPLDRPIDLDVLLEEAQTGRIMFGIGVNSDAGVIGNIVIDEQNFDISRWPRSFSDLLSGAFRGAGQRFRLEALPGSQVQRYSASFSDPYLFNSAISFGLSGFFYNRRFFDWDEQRLGGRVSLGYIFPERPDLSTSLAFRYEGIDIYNPRVPTPRQLAEVVGNNDLYSVRWDISHDTRDNAYLPSEGHLIRLAFEQTLGSFMYPRFEGDYRVYFVTRQRPDRSGRHVFGMSLKLGVSGEDTPIYDHFFAGGFSTIRGFDFRGASPRIGSVVVGGEFQVLTSAEYRFPLTADDNLYGSFFLDAGTVEEKANITWSDVRITPGFELRVNIPALGPVPLAIGLGVPIQHERGDRIRNFHFFVGVSR